MASPFTPVVFYRDPMAALRWLEKAFGFETCSSPMMLAASGTPR